MLKLRTTHMLAVAGLLAAASACDGGPQDVRNATGSIKIDGSSTVYPITEAVAEEFKAAAPRVRVTVGISGTGGGFKKFCRGEIDVANASRPISESEMKAAKEAGIEYVELPICFDALTVVVNPTNTWCDTITVEELRRIWSPEAENKVTKWSHVRPEWPDEKIDLFGPGTDSGTFDYFTEAIVGKSRSSRSDYTASEDDNVIVRGIQGSKHSLGYVGYAYFAASEGSLAAVKIDWEKDTVGPIEPSTENVLAGVYNPLSRPLFIYVNKQAAASKPHVRQFVDFYLQHAKELATEVHYVPLSDKAYAMVTERFAKLQSGTGFAGRPAVGVRVEEVLNRPLSDEVKAAEAGAKKAGGE